MLFTISLNNPVRQFSWIATASGVPLALKIAVSVPLTKLSAQHLRAVSLRIRSLFRLKS